MQLGDAIERALSIVGVTKAKVESWLGAPCGCEERQQKLNQLGAWANRVISGRVNRAREFIRVIIGLDNRESALRG